VDTYYTKHFIPTYTSSSTSLTSRSHGIHTSERQYHYTEITAVQQLATGYTCRPIDIPPIEGWKPDVEFHDSNKVNGLDFPSKIRQSRFSSFKDIEGMDPFQVPLWKFLYQGLHNTWLRRIAYGRETFVLPFDNIGTTVFIAEEALQRFRCTSARK
jgi:hypothetical protein